MKNCWEGGGGGGGGVERETVTHMGSDAAPFLPTCCYIL